MSNADKPLLAPEGFRPPAEPDPSRYYCYFNAAPVPFFILDLSALGSWFDGLRRRKIVDIESYVLSHPGALRKAVKLIQITDANKAAMELLEVRSNDMLPARITRAVFYGKDHSSFREVLKGIWRRDSQIKVEIKGALIHGERVDFLFHLDFRQGDDISLSEVRACLIDITMRRQLEREVVEIVQEEQRRIGIELHDNLGQQITGMTILAKFMQRSLKEEQSTQVQAMADLLSLIQETADDVRKLSQQLSPGEVEAGELPGRLQTLADRITNSGVQCRLRANGGFDDLDPIAGTHAFRIIQEAVNNALKHGRPDTVTVILGRHANQLHITVMDDGIGISEEAMASRSRGIGLRTMHYRCHSLGGAFDISRRSRGGTVVRCSFPIGDNPLNPDTE